MLNVFKCPACRRRIQTDQGVGRKINCPYCGEPFTLRESLADGGGGELLAKVAIPLGYVLFVAVPMGLTIWYFTRNADKKPEPAPQELVQKNEDAERPDPPPPKVKPKPPRKPRPGGNTGKTTQPDEPDPDEPDEPEKPKPKPKSAPVRFAAPMPREVAEVFFAPEPREIVWKVPYRDYESKWQTVGLVDLRVAGLAVTKVPIIDGKGQVRDSNIPLLVIAVEARANTPSKKRELNTWTFVRKRYSAVFAASGKELGQPELQLGSRYHTGQPMQQLMPPDGTPVRDLLMYEVPPDGSGELSLRLEGDRVGESGDIWFKIPDAAWKK